VERDFRSFTVEMYTPGEIVDGRRSYGAETARDALLAAKAWIDDGNHNATRLRVVDVDGTIMFDKPVAELAQCRAALIVNDVPPQTIEKTNP
jgi:hypothetical protein